MPNATNQQVQVYVDTRMRVRAEQIRGLLDALLDDKAAIDDVYAACSAQNPTWTDQRTDGPPHLLGPTDVLAYNSYITALIPHIRDASDYAIMLSACVQPING